MENENTYDFIFSYIKELVIRTNLDMNKNAPDNLTAHLSQRITEMIEKRYRTFSKKDFTTIFDLGIEGRFGEFKGLTFPTVARWFNLYNLSQNPDTNDFSMTDKLIKLNNMIQDEIKNGTSRIPNLKEMFSNEHWISERKKQGRYL